MRRKKVSIIHFNPWYKFPPLLNLFDYVIDKYSDIVEIRVITTTTRTDVETFIPEGFSVYQFQADSTSLNKLARYIWINVKMFFQLIRFRPDIVMYYETISVAPVYLYCLFFRPKLFIHYHELMTKEEYKATGFQTFLRKLEMQLYPKSNWISHTNTLRMDYFIGEYSLSNAFPFRIMENFPAYSWSSKSKIYRTKIVPLQFLYIGALDMEKMYVKEFLQWIKTKHEISLTIYSQNDGRVIDEYCAEMGITNVFFKGFIPYKDIPAILPYYSIGLVWYKPQNLNFTYNAPNKLFEYYSGGLEVWFPKELKGAYSYIKTDSDPRILAVDYTNKNDLDGKYQSFFNARPLSEEPNYNYETVYEKLIYQWLK